MKEPILSHYGKERISEKLVNDFVKDARNGKIKFELDLEEDSYNFN